MPSIRDTSWTYESSTGDGGVTIPLPNNSAGDVLMAFVMGDTGAPTWTLPNGWGSMSSHNNTVSTLVAFKVSNGSEASQVTFTASVNETYNGAIVSVRDAYTASTLWKGNQNSTAFRYGLTTSTTGASNSIILGFVANNAAGVPSLIEGNAHSLVGADGAAESFGLGWMWNATASSRTIAASVSQVAGGAGVQGLYEVSQFSASQSVIPPYITEDRCIYIDPLNGTTAYNSNVMWQTSVMTSSWGLTFALTSGTATNIPGVTAAAADTGLNSFHSSAQITTGLTANGIHGAQIRFAAANVPNVTGKNVLFHLQASTPIALQRTPNISSYKGVIAGMRSATGSNYKLFEVLGSDSPGAADRPIPIIINDSATSTVSSNGTLNPSAILAFGFWCGGKPVGTAIWQFLSMWLMDSTTICGGNASEPIDIPGIVGTIANSHERRSAVLQGANQMLLLQQLNIGNGGTNSVYLDLDSTAIEFPSQYNTTTKKVTYHSVDNKIGITYNAGPNDTIKHRNSVISSPSRYRWGLTESSSTSATYDFSALAVIGAGVVSLPIAVTISQLTINDYVSLDISNLDLVDSSILNVPSNNDSVTNNGDTYFLRCSIDTSGVSSGNRWISATSANVFYDCDFTGGGGHAIRLTSTGTYTFTDCTWTSYGADGSNGAAILNDSGGLITLNIVGGTTPTYKNGAGASTTLVINPVDTTIVVKDINTLALLQNARVLITADSGGDLPYQEVVTISNSGTTATVTHTGHGMENGKKVLIKGASLTQNNGVFTLTYIDANSYSYTMGSAPGSSPTGTILATAVIIDGLTDVNGEITDNRSFSVDQPITGRVRKSSSSTYYKTSPISGTIDSTTGFSTTIQLIPDE